MSFLIDGSGYIFRAYHALPPLTRASDGLPVGAVHGFCQMLWKLLRDVTDDLEPTHLAVIFDTKIELSQRYLSQNTRPIAPLPLKIWCRNSRSSAMPCAPLMCRALSLRAMRRMI